MTTPRDIRVSMATAATAQDVTRVIVDFVKDQLVVLCVIGFRIERLSSVAAYMQIVQQTRQASLLGRLKIGDQLPTARELVAHTGINPNTVLKAYRQLDAEGLVETRAGAGTFVIQTPPRADAVQASQAGVALGGWLRDAKQSGLTRAEVEALVKAGIDDVFAAEPHLEINKETP